MFIESQFYENSKLGSTYERVESFFSPRMRHHAGRPTTGHYTETMGINTYSQRETDNYTQTLDKHKIKA